MKIGPVGAKWIQTERQTDRHRFGEANNRFTQFCKFAERWILNKYSVKVWMGFIWLRRYSCEYLGKLSSYIKSRNFLNS